MLEDHVIQWIQKLRPRVAQYLFYRDAVEETNAELSQLQGREKIEYETRIVGDFFVSEFYNADFDPWPDLETRIDTIEDLQKLVENDIDRKRFENSIEFIFREEEKPEDPSVPPADPQRDAFFSMMQDAYDINEFYNAVEKSKTEVSEILGESFPSESEQEGSPGQSPDDFYDPEGAESLKARLADILDGHLDSL